MIPTTKKKWKPKDNEKYWYLDGWVNWPGEINVERDKWDAESGGEDFNCFPTKKSALLAAKRIRGILMEVHS